MTILTFPGIGNSGPQHWQTLWEQLDPQIVRIVQRDWDHPACEDWTASLERTVRDLGPQSVIVAHSLACLAVAHWAAAAHAPIKAALLVAVPDPAGPNFPQEAKGFAPLPMRRFAFPSIVVASSDDPYGSLVHAKACAAAWGSSLVEIGAAGHINASSDLGDWPAGQALLRQLK